MGKTDQLTYSRGQVEIAIWRAFSQAPAQTPIKQTFAGRIRKLVDLDRAQPEVPNGQRYAFHSVPPPGKGAEVRFTLADAFCLSIGLDLLDLGFKQSEVVFLLRHIRAQLEARLGKILADPPILRSTTNGPDKRVFMLLRKVELGEVLPEKEGSAGSVFLTPDFCRGDAIENAIGTLGYNDRSRVIIELAEMAVLLEQNLLSAPERHRGRAG
ncbi:hypothetical protein [Erythrobacter aurantius]|uniref:hypothetical protein n=1 Tax=Erythrobacter aurantius TaxID=2909249 RepID=UPI00207A8371|nr:hypothetical protein [Erythrobacter aurantius]